jgi:hypothetical protein
MLRGIITTEFPGIQPKQVSIVTEEESGDVIIEAKNISKPAIRLSRQDLSSLLDHHVHFSHMGMEPRNILLRKDPAALSRDQYELAAIIDWEMAGFYPDGLEDMHKTTGFGFCSVVWDWYDGYMNLCANQPPRDQSVVRFMEAVHLIRNSTELQFKGVSKRLWVEYREILELEYDPRKMRTVRRPGGSSTSKYSTKPFLEWRSKCLDRILKNNNQSGLLFRGPNLTKMMCAGRILIPSNRNTITSRFKFMVSWS